MWRWRSRRYSANQLNHDLTHLNLALWEDRAGPRRWEDAARFGHIQSGIQVSQPADGQPPVFITATVDSTHYRSDDWVVDVPLDELARWNSSVPPIGGDSLQMWAFRHHLKYAELTPDFPYVVYLARTPDFPYVVHQTDPERFYFSLDYGDEDIEWVAELDWLSAGQSGSVRIDDAGAPFSSTAFRSRPVYIWNNTGQDRRDHLCANEGCYRNHHRSRK